MVANPISGDIVGGRYRLGPVLGSGGSGTVWQAHDQLLDRTVAIKELRLSPHVTDEQRTAHTAQAMTEARTTARLHHPGIVTVFDVVDDGIRPWIVMQYVDGRSLEHAVAEDGVWAPERAARLAAEILVALATAHAAGIIHRDVKPSNILVPTNGGAMLTDFSIARQVGAGTVANTNIVMGSPGYIAPERITNGQVAPSADLFGLGATLFFAVEGHGPFDADDAMASAFAAAIRPHPRAEHAGVLIDVIDGLLVKDPRHRLTIEQALEMLAEILATQPPPTATESSAAVVADPAAVAQGSSTESAEGSAGAIAGKPSDAAAPDASASDAGVDTAAPVVVRTEADAANPAVEAVEFEALSGPAGAAEFVDVAAAAEARVPGEPAPWGRAEPDDETRVDPARAAFDEPTPQPHAAYDLWSAPPLRTPGPDLNDGGTPTRRRRTPILIGSAVLVILLVVAAIVIGHRPSHTLDTASNNAPVASVQPTCCEASPTPSAPPAVQPSPTPPPSPTLSPTPAGVITSISVSVTIGAAPGCVGTVTAVVHVTGPMTVRISENATDSANTHTGTAREWTFHGTGLQRHTMNLGTVSGTHNGTVTVHSTVPNTRYTTRTWSAPTSCRPGFAIGSASLSQACPGTTFNGSIAVHTYLNSGPVTYTATLFVDNSPAGWTSQQTVNPNSTFSWPVSQTMSLPAGPHTYRYSVSSQLTPGTSRQSATGTLAPCGP
jgi:hypothetical protein